MFKRTKLSTGLLVAFGGALSIAGGGVHAQAQQDAQKLERVTVTGSNIKRTEAETASPVQVIGRDDIEKSGKASVAELLQTLAVDNQGSVPTTFGNGFAAGASGISLRGLGAASTLVLLNGRRIAPYGLADDGQKVFADLNIIPMEAVERVEILKDGASSIYGSDAIAGVVNVILRKDYQGFAAKASYGQAAKYHDGKETRASFTTGFGNLDSENYNVLFNLELGKKDAIWYRDRTDRGPVGQIDLRPYGFSAQQALGGTGAITGANAAGSSINGNVRDPRPRGFDADGNPILYYYNRGSADPTANFTNPQAGAACTNFTSHPQGDPGDGVAPGGGCLIDGTQVYNQVQPEQKNINFFTRGTLNISPNMQAYSELNLYGSRSNSSSTPSGVSGSVGYPGGPVSNAAIALGNTNPDNPYAGAGAARLRYLAGDVGPRLSEVESKFLRFVAGLKGTYDVWDYDTGFLYSENKVTNTRDHFLQRDAAFALLNPTGRNLDPTGAQTNAQWAAAHNAAYAALPAGTFWRIAENAGLNNPAVYAALSPQISNDAKSATTQIDFKATREIGQLAGGAMGIAFGAEARHESVRLDPTTGTDTGNIIGLGYSAYDGSRNVYAAYAELNAPVLKTLELSAALRGDHYSDVGNSWTPKVGAKWTPVKEFALRGTYAQGFRAPGAAENGKGGLAAFSTAADPVRCAAGVLAACDPATVAIITSPNPNLVPEKSRSTTIGFIFEPAARTSVSVDFWQIVRKNEINQETTDSAILAGHVARDPSTSQGAGDPGAITAVLANYVNSNRTTVRGVDVDLRQGFDFQASGKLTLGLQYTHLYTWEREEQDGTKSDFAGTHGNCDVTNCIGTPDNRANFSATYELGAWRVGGVVNYRGAFDNKLRKEDDFCASSFADGSDAPAGCKIASFTTVDMNLRWKPSKNWEVFGSILNLFDKKPPLDPLTYGAQSYNPLDYSGAVGRYWTVGGKYQF